VVCDELIRLSSEAVLNAFRHARAKNIEVNLTYHRTRLQMSIRDDGVGMDQNVIELGGRRGHFGLAGMRERAKRIQAEFTLSSRARTGTEIEISVPAAMAYTKRTAHRWQFWRHAFVK